MVKTLVNKIFAYSLLIMYYCKKNVLLKKKIEMYRNKELCIKKRYTVVIVQIKSFVTTNIIRNSVELILVLLFLSLEIIY